MIPKENGKEGVARSPKVCYKREQSMLILSLFSFFLSYNFCPLLITNTFSEFKISDMEEWMDSDDDSDSDDNDEKEDDKEEKAQKKKKGKKG